MSSTGRPLTSASAPPRESETRFKAADRPSGTMTSLGLSARSMRVPSTSRKSAQSGRGDRLRIFDISEGHPFFLVKYDFRAPGWFLDRTQERRGWPHHHQESLLPPLVIVIHP